MFELVSSSRIMTNSFYTVWGKYLCHNIKMSMGITVGY